MEQKFPFLKQSIKIMHSAFNSPRPSSFGHTLIISIFLGSGEFTVNF